MLKIQVIAIGRVKEEWMRQGIAEYQKRLGAYCRFEIIELEEYRLPDNPSEAEIARGLEEEGNLKSGCLSFIIGGSYGVSPQVKAAAARRISFSRLTFPHQLARVLLCEQLYRACAINAGAKYHKYPPAVRLISRDAGGSVWCVFCGL